MLRDTCILVSFVFLVMKAVRTGMLDGDMLKGCAQAELWKLTGYFQRLY